MNSFAEWHPDDPWLKYRNRDGTFKHWLHTWTWATNKAYAAKDGPQLTLMPFVPPCPWLWPEEPDGEWIQASACIGLFDRAPMPWSDCVKQWIVAGPHGPIGPIYGVVLQSINDDALDRHVDSMRRSAVTEIDLIAFSDRHFSLFKRKEY